LQLISVGNLQEDTDMKANTLVLRVVMFAVVLCGVTVLSKPVKARAFSCVPGHNCLPPHGKLGRCGGNGGCFCFESDGTVVNDTVDCAQL
jgi:hypothetical protein